jgi:hypothetical protein
VSVSTKNNNKNNNKTRKAWSSFRIRALTDETEKLEKRVVKRFKNNQQEREQHYKKKTYSDSEEERRGLLSFEGNVVVVQRPFLALFLCLLLFCLCGAIRLANGTGKKQSVFFFLPSSSGLKKKKKGTERKHR